MTLPEITTTITALKVAAQLTKSILALNKDTAINEKAIELQNMIISIQTSMLDLQSKYYELLQSNENIKNQLSHFENWAITENHYDLYEIGTGVYVYVPSSNHPHPEPKHFLCTNCFQKKNKSLLQLKKSYGTGYGEYYCPDFTCKMEIFFHPEGPIKSK